jgi:hypothetical protein
MMASLSPISMAPPLGWFGFGDAGGDVQRGD